MKMGAGVTGSNAPSPVPLEGDLPTGALATGEEVEAGGLTMAREGSRGMHSVVTGYKKLAPYLI